MDALFKEVDPLRQASRDTVRELGMLQEKFGDFGVSMAQCHSLIELGHRGVLTAGELAEILRLDKSTMSRVVAGLKRAGLIAIRDAARDKRKKPLMLTARGKKKLERIHQHSNRQVQDALALLNEDDRKTVVAGMAMYAKALARSRAQREFEVRRIEERDNPEVAGIIRRVMPEFGADGPGFAIHDPEVDFMSKAYAGKKAGYWVLAKNGTIVGGGGFAGLISGPKDVCELRKMYFLPEVRGAGMGRKLLEHVLVEAKKAGFKRCYLETLATMTRARALYEAAGFEKICEPMGATGHFGCDSWMIRRL
jgi:putative acetyltransferase